MAGAETLSATRDGLLDGHLGITETDGLGLPAGAGPNHKLLIGTGRPAWAIAG